MPSHTSAHAWLSIWITNHRGAVLDLYSTILQQAAHRAGDAHLGGTVGMGPKIGANAAVISDIQPFVTAVGVPAKIVQQGPSDSKAESDRVASRSND